MTPDYNFWVLLFCLIILTATIVYTIRMDNADKKNKIKKHTALSNLLYIYGHPQLSSPQEVSLSLTDDELLIESKENYHQEVSIAKQKIIDLTITDKSTLEEEDPTTLKIYLGYWEMLASRMAMKKHCFLFCIVWEDEQCTHATTFEFSGYQAARNVSLVHLILSSSLAKS